MTTVLADTDPRRALSKEAARERMRRTLRRLSDLQSRLRDSDRSALIAIEGPDESGKTTIALRLMETLDPRGFRVWHTYAAEPHELRRPWLWRFWIKIPRAGAMACFDRSWYGRVLVERVEGLISKEDLDRSYREIMAFEKTLQDGGAVIVKLLMNLSKKEQRRRFEDCEADPNQKWRIKKRDWRAHELYSKYERAFEDMVRRTSTPRDPWRIIPADDLRTSIVLALDEIARGLAKGLR
jgi:polyphosphate kinase 2 (PPK2 family)